MDGYEEKKWFVYMGDHHEGPFSLAEIQAKMAQGMLTSASFVWCEGMGDWKPMTDVSAFSGLVATPGDSSDGPAATAPALNVTLEPKDADGSPGIEFPPLEAAPSPGSDIAMPTLEEAPGQESAASYAEPAVAAANQGATLDSSPGVSPPQESDSAAIPPSAIVAKKPRRVSLVKWGILITLLLALSAAVNAYLSGAMDPFLQSPGIQAGIDTAKDFSRPVLEKVAEKVPAIGRFISPIPPLTDVTEEEYKELQAAAREKLETAGPRITLALSRENPLAPVFYVASNLPDGTELDLYVEGIADTLLNQLSFSGKVSVRIEKRLGKSDALRLSDGKPIPRGEYQVFVTEGANLPETAKAALASIQVSMGQPVPESLPKGIRILGNRSYFLGGMKDAVYAARLKEFHDKLQAKASAELAEVKQLSMTLESQLLLTLGKFAELQKMKVTPKTLPARRQAWENFHTQWVALSNQLKETLKTWTPEALEKEFFYGMLFQMVLQADQSVESVHTLHHAFLTSSVDAKAFEIQLGQSASVAQSAIAALKAKIEQAEKIPPSANGLPRKEGL